MRNRAWVVFAVLAAASSVAYFTQDGRAGQAAAVLPRRVRRRRGDRRSACGCTGPPSAAPGCSSPPASPASPPVTWCSTATRRSPASRPPFPYWSDVLYLGCYVFLMAGPRAARLRDVRARTGRAWSTRRSSRPRVGPAAVGLLHRAVRRRRAAARCSPAPSPSPTRSPTSGSSPSWPGCGSRRSAGRSPCTLLGWRAAPLLVADVVYGAHERRRHLAHRHLGRRRLAALLRPAGRRRAAPVARRAAGPGAPRPAPQLTPARGAGLMLATMVAPGMLRRAGEHGGPRSSPRCPSRPPSSCSPAWSWCASRCSSTRSPARRPRPAARRTSRADRRRLRPHHARPRATASSATRARRAAACSAGTPPSSSARTCSSSPTRRTARGSRTTSPGSSRDGAATPLEVRLRSGGAGWQWVETLASAPTEDEDGELCVVLTSRDVGERKDLEEQLTRAGAARPAHRAGQPPAVPRPRDARPRAARRRATSRCCSSTSTTSRASTTRSATAPATRCSTSVARRLHRRGARRRHGRPARRRRVRRAARAGRAGRRRPSRSPCRLLEALRRAGRASRATSCAPA